METKTISTRKNPRKRSYAQKKKGKKFLRQKGFQTVNQLNRGSNSLITMQNTSLNPFPPSIKVNLRYFDLGFDLNPGVAGVQDEYVFSANGLYDPDISGTGHQPLGFDQWMSMYDHYTVVGSRITVFGRNNEASYSQFLGVRYSDTASVSTDQVRTIENGRCVYRLLGAANDHNDTGSVSMGMNIGKMLGRPQPLNEDSLRGSISGNPAEQAYWHIFAFPDSAADTSSVRVSVQIEYVAVFTEPKLLATS